ncbi:hypothetical protein DBR28_21275 [Chryseobacterium sp. HMWF028]|nr:hypothetical protein DBR28_21275 [Chryseobacterium sp. HMWF028]
MKKISFLIILLFSFISYSQVGINTPQPNSTLVVEGSYEGAYKTVNANTTLGSQDQYVSAEGSSSLTITLPDASIANSFSGRIYHIKNNTAKDLTISGFGSQLLKINGLTSSNTYILPAGFHIRIVKNDNAIAAMPLWDILFSANSLPPNSRSLQYTKAVASPIDVMTPNYSVASIGNLMIGFTGTSPSSQGYLSYSLKINSPTTIWYNQAPSSAIYAQHLVMNGYWYNIGNALTPNNRDIIEAIIIVHATKEVYRITVCLNGDIAASGSVPAVVSGITVFAEKLD